MNSRVNDKMFAELTAFTDFGGVVESRHYKPLPDDWFLATSDIVGSTSAIKDGRYKAVNMAGASVISAILNALNRRDVPFVFGGDGAVVAVPGTAIDIARQALAEVQTWVAEELDLKLRAAVVPVADIRAAGSDVLVARFQVSPEVSYAMFSGGGASWAEAQMRAGRYVVAPAPPGSRPDLTGLSCRWQPIPARHGEILSVIVIPGAASTGDAFRQLAMEVVAIASGKERFGNPVSPSGPSFGFSRAGLAFEARASAPKGRRLGRLLRIAGEFLLAVTLDRLGRPLGGFDPKVYRSDVAANSDFRKFDDGLKMTVDIDAGQSRRIAERLEDASRAGICRYGLHSQNTAIMTCMVPSVITRDHMHFIDGSSGGYAVAASHLKAQEAAN